MNGRTHKTGHIRKSDENLVLMNFAKCHYDYYFSKKNNIDVVIRIKRSLVQLSNMRLLFMSDN